MREKLLKILSVPIYPHELVDPLEAVADYLLDNDVVPVVRCRDCKMHYPEDAKHCEHCALTSVTVDGDDFCSYGERKDDAGKTN